MSDGSDPGARFPANFADLQFVAEGGEGAVYSAFDRRRGIRVAVKTLRTPSPGQAYILKQEFRALGSLRHPGLVRLYDLGVDTSGAWFSMEFVEGAHFVAALADARARGGEALVGKFLSLAQQVVAALVAVHAGGFLHRDLKPSNVLVGADDRVVLLDFGMVTDLREDRRLTDPETLAGTLVYLPPEAFTGADPGPAWDAYALGVLLCEGLLGHLPFARDLALALPDKLHGPGRALRAALTAIDPEVAACVIDLLDPAPERRPDMTAVGVRLAARLTNDRADAATPPRVLVGREEERAALRAWGASPGFAIAWVAGPSGIGKTTLVRGMIGELRAAGEFVLAARCHPNEMVPFNGLDPILEDMCRLLLRDETRELAHGLGEALVALFPAFGRLGWTPPASPAGGAAEVLEQGLQALAVLLRRIAERHRLTLWIDDVQWADRETLRVLQMWARATEPPPVRICLVARERCAADLPLALQVELGELPSAAAERLARQLLPASEAEAVARVCSEGRGNPLLLEQLARSVSLTGSAGSTTLEAVIAAAIADLPADAAPTLALLAVAGRPLELDLLGACGVPRALAFELEHRQLATRSGQGLDCFEVVHDRLRGAVLAGLDEHGRASHHGRLADALIDRARDADAPQIAGHLHAGRGPAAAAPWARRAGQFFASAFAFDSAAEWFRHTLAWTGEPGDTRALLADALVRAGRGTEAGREYEQLAREDARTAAQRLQKAAECYLAAGALKEGMAVLQPLIRRRGILWPTDPRRAMLAMLADLGVVAWRSVRPARAAADAAVLHDTDLCWSAAKGLLGLDPVRGAYFALTGLRRILATTDAARVARHYAAVGAVVLAPAGGVMAARGRWMIDRAIAIGEELGDAYLRGFAQVCRGQMALLAGEWAAARRDCQEGGDRLRGECHGSTWELHIGEMGLLRALQELGEFAALRARAAALRDRAVALDDRYAEITGRLYEAIGQVSLRRPEAAREHVRLAFEGWHDRSETEVQRMYAVHILVLCDLVEGDANAAWARLEAAWTRWQASPLLRIPVARIDCLALRIRVAACAAATTRSERAALVRHARAAGKRLRGEPRADARALAQRMDGVLAALDRGDAAAVPDWTRLFPQYIDRNGEVGGGTREDIDSYHRSG
ncbi:MAG: protein kinase [Myxococcales bacterium]|nr:protein kinase [Myxococcales bacterium]